MDIDAQNAGCSWAEDHHDALAQAVARSAGHRIIKLMIDGRIIWIKRYDVEAVPLPKRIHNMLSSLMPYPFMWAGLPVPEIIWTQKNLVILADATPTQQAQLPETSAEAFAAYRAMAPGDVIGELGRIVDFFRFTIRPLRFLKRFYLGGDGKRLLKAMDFFDKALRN